MLGNLWLSQAESGNEVVDRVLAAGEDVQDLSPPRLCYRVEGIRRRRCSRHAHIIYLYRHVSKGFTVGPGKIVAIDILADPARSRGLDLAVPNA